MLGLFKGVRNLELERTYDAAPGQVWRAWTEPDLLRQWWGPEHTTVPTCEVDLRVGGRLFLVMEAGAGMGSYQGTRWPMEGTLTVVEEPGHLRYDARSWTEGEEAGSTIHHTNDVTITAAGPRTVVRLHVAITQVGPKARMAAFGMKWGYKAQLDKLAATLAMTG